MVVYFGIGENLEINFNNSHAIKTSWELFSFKVIYPKICLKLFPEVTLHRVLLEQLFGENM